MLNNKQQFINKSRIIHNNKYNYSKLQYTNNRTKIEIICPEHGSFWQVPALHTKNKHGCPKCGIKTGQYKMKLEYYKFKKEFKKTYPNHDLTTPKTFFNDFKFTFICSHHGEFISTASKILNSWSCPQCCKKPIPNNYLQRLIKTYPHYDYLNSVFINRDNNILVNCKQHGEFAVNFRRHLQGQIGCKECKNSGFKPIIIKENRRNKEDILRRKLFLELFGNNFEYIEFNNGKLTYKCCKHGLQISSWSNIRKGKICKYCSAENFRKNYQLSKQELLKRFVGVHGEKYDYSKLNYFSLHNKITIICLDHGEFEQLPSNHIKGHGCPACKISNAHIIINKYLDSISVDYIINDRKTIKPLEIDCYIPNRKLGIEINGVYWHSLDIDSTDDKHKNRHYFKTLVCIQNNIRLLQFTDEEIFNKQEIVFNIIDNCLCLNKKLHANDLCIKKLSEKETEHFLNLNHIKGNRKIKNGISYGLMDSNEIVFIILLSNNGYNQYKIDRHVDKIGYMVVGGISKLFNYFIETYSPNKITTVIDLCYTIGGEYNQINMVKTNIIKPSYSYIKGYKLNNRRVLYDCGGFEYEWITK